MNLLKLTNVIKVMQHNDFLSSLQNAVTLMQKAYNYVSSVSITSELSLKEVEQQSSVIKDGGRKFIEQMDYDSLNPYEQIAFDEYTEVFNKFCKLKPKVELFVMN